jgi:O-antigen/teichoic acid export membrane protein
MWTSPTARFSFGRLLPAGLGILATPLASRLLGPSGYGSIAIIVAWSAVGATLLCGWLEPMAVRELSSPTRHGGSFVGKALIGMSLAVACGLVLGLLGSYLLGDWGWAFAATASVLTGALGLVIGLARARGLARVFVVAATLGLGSRAIGGSAALILGFGAFGYLIGWAVAAALALLVGLVSIRTVLTRMRPYRPSITDAVYAFSLSGAAVSFLLLQVVDRLTMRLNLSSAEVGRYVLGYSLTELLINLASSVLHARRFPVLLRDWESDRPRAMRSLEANLALSAFLPLVMAPVLFVYGPSVMKLVGGAEFGTEGGMFLVLIAIGLAFCGAAQWLAVDLQATRRVSRWFGVVSGCVVVNATVVLVTADGAGIAAGSIATLLSYAILCFGVIAMSPRAGLSALALRACGPAFAAAAVALLLQAVATSHSAEVRLLLGISGFAAAYPCARVLAARIPRLYQEVGGSC